MNIFVLVVTAVVFASGASFMAFLTERSGFRLKVLVLLSISSFLLLVMAQIEAYDRDCGHVIFSNDTDILSFGKEYTVGAVLPVEKTNVLAMEYLQAKCIVVFMEVASMSHIETIACYSKRTDLRVGERYSLIEKKGVELVPVPDKAEAKVFPPPKG